MGHGEGSAGPLLPRRSRPRFKRSGDSLYVLAPAKLNLNLLVGPRRPDGFHPLDSLVVKIAFYDVLELRRRRDGRIDFACEGWKCGPVKENLVLRAAERLAMDEPVPGVDMVLAKNIPAGRGLGGGSSDAAATLLALRELCELGLPEAKLASIAAELGSDVPLFLGPPACRMRGRGELVEPVQCGNFWAAVFPTDLEVSTGAVYAEFDVQEPGRMDAQLPSDALVGPPSAWGDRLTNDLGSAAKRVKPELAAVWDRLSVASGRRVHLTGSGSALFMLFDDLNAARSCLQSLPPDLAEQAILAEAPAP
jgi:4-diphosphocytidyl-2-C-methyl-D-erythritol kinase